MPSGIVQNRWYQCKKMWGIKVVICIAWARGKCIVTVDTYMPAYLKKTIHFPLPACSPSRWICVYDRAEFQQKKHQIRVVSVSNHTWAPPLALEPLICEMTMRQCLNYRGNSIQRPFLFVATVFPSGVRLVLTKILLYEVDRLIM